MVKCFVQTQATPWRRDNFPHYKYSRKKGREESSFDWDNIFNIITNIKNEIKENFPYVVMYEASVMILLLLWLSIIINMKI